MAAATIAVTVIHKAPSGTGGITRIHVFIDGAGGGTDLTNVQIATASTLGITNGKSYIQCIKGTTSAEATSMTVSWNATTPVPIYSASGSSMIEGEYGRYSSGLPSTSATGNDGTLVVTTSGISNQSAWLDITLRVK